MAILIITLFILGSVAYLYFLGTIVRAFAMVISALCAITAAFAYFEPLANILISRGRMDAGAYTFCFAALFIITFAILASLTLLLTSSSADFGPLPERIGRIICGILLGFILSGTLLTAFAMAPVSGTKPYQRFDPANPDIENPKKSLLNADGFTSGWFSIISGGSFSGKRSFAVLHPDFLDQIFLNRHKSGLPLVTRSEAIEVPSRAVWPAPENLRDTSGKPLSIKAGCKPVIVRIGIKKSASQDAGDFAVSQLRVICKEKDSAKNLLAGKGKNIFPIGYLKAVDRVQIKNLTDQIKIDSADFGTAVKWIDFVFEVPETCVPVLAEFKQNNIAQLSPPVTIDQAPLPEPFIPQSACATGIAQLQPVEGASVYGIELAVDAQFLEGLTLQISDVNQWQSSQTDRSSKPAEFEDDKITVVKAEVIIKEAAQPKEETATEQPKPAATPAPATKQAKPKRFAPKYVSRTKQAKSLSAVGNMLKPLAGYKLVSLKCNNPATGAAIKGEQLPVLVELSGLTHCPVGVIAGGKINDQTVYEVDYCAVPIQDSNTGCLAIAENGCVEKPFPDNVWLTEQAQSISQFYTLYLVKAGDNAIIASVKPAGAFPAAGFVKYEGFSLK